MRGHAIGGDQEEIDDQPAVLRERGIDPASTQRVAADMAALRIMGPEALRLATEGSERRNVLAELVIPYLAAHAEEIRAGSSFDSLRAHMTTEDRALVKELVGEARIDDYLEW
jgi:uncharacterized protein (DUF362 family)